MALLEGNAVNSMSYPELIGAGLVKYGEEKFLSGYIGNGTVKSGLIKGVIGVAAKQFLPAGAARNIVSAGFTIDAVEDILTGVMGGGFFGGSTASTATLTDFVGV